MQDLSCAILCTISLENCKWSAYSEWSECSKSCGGGIRTSTRKIEQEALNGGTPCIGETTRNETCNSDLCPGIQLHIEITIIIDNISFMP